MDGEETPKSSSKKFPGQKSIDTYAVQCHECHKWRVIDSQEQFEDIRSKISEEPFYCDGKSGVSCEDPADLEYNATRTWAIDKPNLSKPPDGFKRHLVVRKDNSKMDVYYITPQGKRLRSQKDIAAYLKANPTYEGISETDFDFARPKIMEDTLPKVVDKMGSASSHKKAKMAKDE